MKKILFICLLAISSIAFSQNSTAEKTISLKENANKTVKIKYSWKTQKDGKKFLKVNFKNKAKTAVETFAEFGFYNNGVLREKGQLTDCLKKSFFNNWFRSYHLIQTETITLEEFNSDNLEVKILEFKIEATDECRETDSE